MISEADVPCRERTQEVLPGVFGCHLFGRCSLDRTHPRLRPCIACDKRIEPPPEPYAFPNCVHRQEKQGTTLCPTCTGKVEVFLFGCSVFGICQRGDKLATVHSCLNCPNGKED